jgi:signal transduction histidine kinase
MKQVGKTDSRHSGAVGEIPERAFSSGETLGGGGFLGGRGGHDEPAGLSCDIPECAGAVEALRESREYLQIVVDSMAEPLVALDRHRRVVLANRAALTLLRRGGSRVYPCWACAGWTGAGVRACGCAADDCPVERVFSAGGPALLTQAQEDETGRRREIEIVAAPVLGKSGIVKHVVLTYRDVTARRESEELARRHLDELARAARLSAMGEMASGFAHELNQPLMAIAAYAAAGLRRLGSSPGADPEMVGTLERVAQQAQRAGEVIRRIRRFVRPQPAAGTTHDINESVREAVEMLAHDLTLSSVSVKFDLAAGPVLVCADRIAVQQVVMNLLRNGRDAMAGTAPAERQLTVSTRRCETGEVEVAVADRGCGLPAGSEGRLFDAFFTTKAGGMGMGLAISRSIIDGHGGRLWAAAGPAGGAVFTFTLPGAQLGGGLE